jgi:hypothetical protein
MSINLTRIIRKNLHKKFYEIRLGYYVLAKEFFQLSIIKFSSNFDKKKSFAVHRTPLGSAIC